MGPAPPGPTFSEVEHQGLSPSKREADRSPHATAMLRGCTVGHGPLPSNGYIGMCNGYVAGGRQNQLAGRNVQRNQQSTELCGHRGEEVRRHPKEKIGKNEKHPRQAGMSKRKNGLPGYVAGGGRENWD